ncbi:uncharacterized protein LOC105428323 [Pogonomyrmex barbatus]|uniref:Uncharacterized protein LOC105428323 n=1 Tax=Pogonomyrmex barbatus TaxID=144034 RepID=A0A6I9WA84_9HYME|nr:uncharacterized protein LOC105428323 [Pogonomyrmex barbatus]
MADSINFRRKPDNTKCISNYFFHENTGSKVQIIIRSMRVHLMLIFFFAGTVLAQSVRNKRDTVTITEKPPFTSIPGTNNESTTTNISKNNSDGINRATFNHPLNIISRFILLLPRYVLSTFLKMLIFMGTFILRIMIKPFILPFKMIRTVIKMLLKPFLKI